jgi:hypothetical protein
MMRMIDTNGHLFSSFLSARRLGEIDMNNTPLGDCSYPYLRPISISAVVLIYNAAGGNVGAMARCVVNVITVSAMPSEVFVSTEMTAVAGCVPPYPSKGIFFSSVSRPGGWHHCAEKARP